MHSGARLRRDPTTSILTRNARGDRKSKKKVKKKKQAKDGKGKGKGGKPKGGKPKGGKNNNKGRGGGSPSG